MLNQATKKSFHGSRARHFIHCNVIHTCEIQDGDGWHSPRYVGGFCQACVDIENFEQVSAEVYDESAYFMPVVSA